MGFYEEDPKDRYYVEADTDSDDDPVGNFAGHMKSYGQALYKDTRKLSKGKKGSKSIISSAKGNIFEFPVFISSNVPLDYATATTSLLEQVYASYLQMAISQNPIIDSRTAVSKQQFQSLKSNTNRYLEYTDTQYQHDAYHNLIKNDDGVVLEFDMISIEDNEAAVINEQLDYQPLAEFDHYFQEARTDRPRHGMYDEGKHQSSRTQTNSKSKTVERDPITGKKINTTKTNSRTDTTTKSQFDRARDVESFYNTELQNEKLENELNEDRVKREDRIRDLEEDIKNIDKSIKQHQKDLDNVETPTYRKEKLKEELDKLKAEREMSQKKLNDYEDERDILRAHKNAQINKAQRDIDDSIRKERWENQDRRAEKMALASKSYVRAPELLDDSKVKKLNTMKPLMMTVNLNVMDDHGGLNQVQYIVGVKTFSRIVDASVLPEVVKYPIKEMDKMTRKAKWRAGELKFFKDIVFRKKEKKQTAYDSKDPNRKWYRRLYELAHMSGDAPATAVISGQSLTKLFFKERIDVGSMGAGMIPNASLIISKADVDMVKAETNIDLLKGSVAKKFCKELFMISMVVIDNDAESIKIILPDMHSDYDVHSLAAVNRQLAELDTAGSKTRDVFKLLG